MIAPALCTQKQYNTLGRMKKLLVYITCAIYERHSGKIPLLSELFVHSASIHLLINHLIIHVVVVIMLVNC